MLLVSACVYMCMLVGWACILRVHMYALMYVLVARVYACVFMYVFLCVLVTPAYFVCVFVFLRTLCMLRVYVCLFMSIAYVCILCVYVGTCFYVYWLGMYVMCEHMCLCVCVLRANIWFSATICDVWLHVNTYDNAYFHWMSMCFMLI